jgi:hypothetical protein
MKLNSIQVAGLRALAAVPVRETLDVLVEDVGMLPAAQAAHALGKIDGRAELARELLQEAADRGVGKRCSCAASIRANVGADAGGTCLACGGAQ